MDAAGYFNIGRRNVDSLQGHLHTLGLRVEATAVGGMVNRTMYLQVASGEVWLKVSGEPEELRLCKR
jgi:chemotaxis protein CheD